MSVYLPVLGSTKGRGGGTEPTRLPLDRLALFLPSVSLSPSSCPLSGHMGGHQRWYAGQSL